MNRKKISKKNGFSKIISGIVIIAFILFMVLYNLPKTPKSGNNSVKKSSIKFQKDGELTFQSADEKYISMIDIEIADDDNKRTTGLMDRLSMEEKQGMLFVFPHESFQSFWMKNTVISLDIIFVDRNNEIVTIHKNTVPFDTSQYQSTKPASQVVEVIAGYTDLYNINIGDKIVWRRN
ncbi:MAG: DUF192 domain-containing protein [Bacteroidetes bacterium]|nr:DUF192 domain-containing protein [Bacteroidota bacterium]MBU1113995.1 DUF192 domain-containing protein [Bacteroidota bacterium]MBU1799815.1 DUF192 domain-containing protein [Bacteroidota bacterium]